MAEPSYRKPELGFPASVGSRRRNLVGLKCQNWRASGGAPGPLPSGYTKLEYIRNTEERGAWATLPLVLNTDRIEFRIQNEADNFTRCAHFFGWSRGPGFAYDSNVGLALAYPTSGSFVEYQLHIGRAFLSNRGRLDFGILDDISLSIDFAAQSVTLNSEPYEDAERNWTKPFSGGSSVYAPRIGFCVFDNMGEDDYAQNYYLTGMGKYYGYRQTRDGVDICNLVPCRRDSDMVHGFYDLVSDSFVRSESGVDWVA